MHVHERKGMMQLEWVCTRRDKVAGRMKWDEDGGKKRWIKGR